MNFSEETKTTKSKTKPSVLPKLDYPSSSPRSPSPPSSSRPPSPRFSSRSSSYSKNDSEDTSNFFDFKTILILCLCAFLLLILVGINIFTILGNSLTNLSDVFKPFILNFLKALGYSTGKVINTSADTVSDVAKTSIDIAEGSIQDIGNLLISASEDEKKEKSLEKTVQKDSSSQSKPNQPNPDNSSNSIQKPITSDKSSWCLIGEFQNKRGCVPITESDKCLSGQIFPNQAMCLNPTLTP
jgi:hypothetical protein